MDISYTKHTTEIDLQSHIRKYVTQMSYLHCKSFTVKNFHGFHRLIGYHETFLVKYKALAISLGYSRLM